MSKICALVLVTLVSLVSAEEQNSAEDPFTFDYHRLRVGGLILAAVLCLIGITILLSKMWPLQMQVQPGQEKEDRKQCSADAHRPRPCLRLLELSRVHTDFPATKITWRSSSGICDTRSEAFVFYLERSTGSSLCVAAVRCDAFCLITVLLSCSLHLHTNTHTRTYIHSFCHFHL